MIVYAFFNKQEKVVLSLKTMWKGLMFGVVFLWDLATGKFKKEVEEYRVQEQQSQRSLVQDLQHELSLLLRITVIPSEIAEALDYAIEKEESSHYRFLRDYQLSIDKEVLPNQKDRLERLLSRLRPLRRKVIFLENLESLGFLNSLMAHGEWQLFINKREDYAPDGGAAMCDYWAEHTTNGWKVVVRHQSLLYYNLLCCPPTPSQEKIEY